MAGRPLVSMLLIAYRQAATVQAAVAGALAQSYTPLEIIVSDDASDDAFEIKGIRAACGGRPRKSRDISLAWLKSYGGFLRIGDPFEGGT